ncbi:MAG: sulfatase-like hydrolase/transferase [Polyangiaceae bacterium]|nr:sulfatase-like hydrolase/transferase [Polyangiaceae bacterium]
MAGSFEPRIGAVPSSLGSPDPVPGRTPRRRRLIRLFGGALLGAEGGLLAGAILEMLWVRAATNPAPPPLGLLLALLGIGAPIGILVGIAVAVGIVVVHGAELPSLGHWRATLRAGSAQERATRAGALLVGPSAVVLFMIATGRLALGALVGSEPALVAGASVAFGAALVAIALSTMTSAAARALASVLARHRVGPVLALAIGLGFGIALLGYGVLKGDVGGAGGPLAMFGVLRREELDLRLPALILGMMTVAYLASAWCSRVSGWMSLPLGVLPLVSTIQASGPGLNERTLALSVERSAPLSRRVLPVLRWLTDHDADGVSSRFGGGDCDDSDPAVRPGADDLPGNGVDEDCTGSDAAEVVMAPPAKAPPTVAEWIDAKLPRDLNVVLLSIDALRWDAVGFMGYPKSTTPNLDRLAAESVVFERAYALASYTGKSIPPMMIGKYGSETHRDWAHFNRIDRRDTLVWERLQRAGVRTLSVQGYWYFFRKGIGFERGWDVLDGSVAPSIGYVEEDKTSTSDKIADRTIAVLDDPANQGRRLFFWTHYVDTHADYVPHPGFDLGSSQRARYDGEIAFTDHHVGRVLDHIRKGPLGSRTAIIITSDHGEAFGEHGMIRHGFEIWEPLVRVPLLVYLPGVGPRRIAAARSLIDLVPTLLELFRAPAPSGEGDDFVSGQSLVADLLAPPGYRSESRIVFIDMAAGPNNAERQGFLEDGRKLVTSNGRPLGLFDLDADPEEAHDRLDDAAERELMTGRFQAFRRQLRSVVVRQGSR